MNFFVLDDRRVVVATMTSNAEQDSAILVEDEAVFAEGQSRIGRCAYIDGALVDYDPPPEPAVAPDGPTLRDWRVGLTLWGRLDDVTARVNGLIASSDPQKSIRGKVARESLERANNVLRDQLMQLAPSFNFTPADVDESLWRADRVSRGDLTGVWPVPAA